MVKQVQEKYSIGIIGAGSIVESCHLPVLKSLASVQIEWVYDRNIARSKLLADMYNVPVLQGDWEKSIPGIDICLLTIPYGARKPYIEKIATEKKALYVEKPFAVSFQEHLNWCELFSGANLAIGFQRRFYRIVKNIKSIVESEIFGELKSIDFKQGYYNLKGGASYLSDANMAGGGVIIESAIHTLDIILYFCNARDIQLKSMKTVSNKGIDYDSIFETTIVRDGSPVQVNAHVSTLQNLENGLKLYFEKAVLVTSLSPDAVVKIIPVNNSGSFSILEESNQQRTFSGADSVIGSFGLFWNEYINALNLNKENITSSRSSLLTTKWIESIYAHVK